MPQLVAVRLVDIGHKDARMEDLTIPFERNGAPTDTVVWLRNGGGKSSILNLNFSVLRPSLREFLGAKADQGKRHLSQYIQNDDHSVVAEEWRLDDPDRSRYLTIAFYERKRGGTMSDTPERHFFAGNVLDTVPELTLGGLPIVAEGQNGKPVRRTLSGFRHAWHDLARAHPAAGLVETSSQQEWERVLSDAGIDPGLFRFQLEMNRREGGADDLFKFDTTEAFVDFFLDMVTDPEEGDQVARNLAEHHDTLRKLVTEYQPGRDFAAAMIVALEPLVALSDQRKSALEEAARHRRRLERMKIHLDARRLSLQTDEETAEREKADAVASASHLQKRAHGLRGESLALEHVVATENVRTAEEARSRAHDEHQDVLRRRAIWTAAVPLVEARRHERDALRCLRDLEERYIEHQPLKDALVEAALRYDAVLRYRIERIDESIQEMTSRQASARDEAEGLGKIVSAAREESASAMTDADHAERDIASEANERAQLVDRGVMRADESLADAENRWVREQDRANAEASRTAEVKEQTAAAAAAKREEATQANGEAGLRVDRRGQVDVRITEARNEGDVLAESDLLRVVLETETIEIDRLDAPSTLELIRTRFRHASDRARDLHISLAEHERALAYLEHNRLLPPTPDVERVLALLRAAMPSAMSGWRYIASTMPEDAERIVAERPWLAAGVVVHNDDLHRVPSALNPQDLRLEGPVVVAAQSIFQASGPVDPHVVVLGPSSRALYSEAAARDERARRETLRETQHNDYTRERETEEALRNLASRTEGFRRRYPVGWFAAQVELRATFETEEAEWRERAGVLGREADDLTSDAKRLDATSIEESLAAERAKANIERISLHQSRWGDVEEMRTRLRQFREKQLFAARRADNHEKERIAALARANALGADIVSESSQRALLEKEREAIQYLEGTSPIEALAGSHDEQEQNYAHLLKRFRQEVREDELRARLQASRDEARRNREALKAELTLVSADEVEHALDGLETPDREDVVRMRKDAEAEEPKVRGALGARTIDLTGAQRTLTDVLSRRQQHGAVPTLGDETLDMEQAEIRALEAAYEADAAEIEANKAAAKAEEFQELIETARNALNVMNGHLSRLIDLQASYEDLLQVDLPTVTEDAEEAPADDALGAAITDLSSGLRDLKDRHARLNTQRGRLVAALKAVLESPEFASLKSQHIQKLRRYGDADYEAKASIDHQDLCVRKQMYEDEIALVQPHKEALITQVLDVADKSLRRLQSAQQRSRVPDDVPILGGLDFLKVTTDAPDDSVARRERIARLVDDVTSADRSLPSGPELVHQAVRRLGNPIKVRVLKPKLSGDPEWIGIVAMGRESGGERLTSAIMLYCTLARMRAVTRGTKTSPLLLDNPIGAASWEPFLELQRKVAERSGVQLIYFTGVDALGAIRTMSHVVRLRNAKRDRWSGVALVEREGEAIEAVRADFDAQPPTRAEAIVAAVSAAQGVREMPSPPVEITDALDA